MIRLQQFFEEQLDGNLENCLIKKIAEKKTCTLNQLDEIQTYINQQSSQVQKLLQHLKDLGSNNSLPVKLESQLKTQTLMLQMNKNTRYAQKKKIKDKFNDISTQYTQLTKTMANLQDNETLKKLNKLYNQKQVFRVVEELIDHIQIFNKYICLNSPHFDNLLIPQVYKQDIYNSLNNLKILNQSLKSAPPKYQKAKFEVELLYKQYKQKIFIQFKQAYWKVDYQKIEKLVQIIKEHGNIGKVVEFYIVQNLDIIKKDEQTFFIELEIKLKKCIKSDNYYYKLNNVFGKFSTQILQRFSNYVYENIVHYNYKIYQFIQKNLLVTLSPDKFVQKYYYFYTQCQKIIQILQYNNALTLIFSQLMRFYFSNQYNFLQTLLQQNFKRMFQMLDLKFSGIKQQDWCSMNIKDWIMDYQIEKKNLSKRQIQNRLDKIIGICLSEPIEFIFLGISDSLKRSKKLSKIIESKNNNQSLMELFLDHIGQLIYNIIKLVKQTIPNYSDAQSLNQRFFQVIPLIKILINRVDIIYKTQFVRFINQLFRNKVDSKVNELINKTQLLVTNMIVEAIGSMIISVRNIISSVNYIMPKDTSITKPTQQCKKLIFFINKNIKKINQIYQDNLRKNIVDSLMKQIQKYLEQFYADVKLNREGCIQLAIDIAQFQNINIPCQSLKEILNTCIKKI